MIEYNIDFKFNTKGGAVLLVEIIDDNKFTNEIYEIDGNKKALRELFIDLTNDDEKNNILKESEEVQDWLEDLIQNDDSPYKRGEN